MVWLVHSQSRTFRSQRGGFLVPCIVTKRSETGFPRSEISLTRPTRAVFLHSATIPLQSGRDPFTQRDDLASRLLRTRPGSAVSRTPQRIPRRCTALSTAARAVKRSCARSTGVQQRVTRCARYTKLQARLIAPRRRSANGDRDVGFRRQ